MTQIHTLDDILCFQNHVGALPQETITILNTILKDLEVKRPEKNTSSTHKPSDNNRSSYPRRKKCSKSTYPTLVRSHLSSILTEINKITQNNFETQQVKVLDLIIDHLKDNKNDVVFNEKIWTILHGNTSYVESYVKLFAIVQNKTGIFSDKIDPERWYEHLKKQLDSISVPDLCNYDVLCQMNEENDKRRALFKFYVELASANMVDVNLIMELIIHIQNVIQTLSALENKVDIIEECTEILHVVIVQAMNHSFFLKHSYIDDIAEKTSFIIKSKASSSVLSINNKIIFKMMDILDIIS